MNTRLLFFFLVTLFLFLLTTATALESRIPIFPRTVMYATFTIRYNTVVKEIPIVIDRVMSLKCKRVLK